MVLEEVSRSSPDSYQDDASPTAAFDSTGDTPSAYNDPSQSTGQQEYSFDYNSLPSGLPLIGTLTGYSQQRQIETIGHSLATVHNIVRRPLTQPEVDAVAYHTAKGLSIASYGFPLGVSGGLWRAYNARNTYRFPFFQPDMQRFNPDKFWTLRGEMARKAWHVLRATAYGAIGSWVGRTIVAGYAATVAAAGQRMDNRLKDVIDSINKMGREEANSRIGRGNAQRGQGQGQGGVAQQPSQQGQEGEPQGYGGYTRTAGGDVNYGAGNAGTDTGVMSDSMSRSRDQRQQAPYGTAGAQNTQNTYQMENVSSQPSIFDYDDASPVAPEVDAQRNTNESAWDRLRRGGPPKPQDRPNAQQQSQNAQGDAWSRMRGGGGMETEQRQGSTLGDSFSFSSGSEDERRRERERAQREFDERVEKERKGLDFDNSPRRW